MIKLALTIDLPRPRDPDVRYTPAFSALAQQLRASLREEEGPRV
jgi:hypothetical protein